MSLPLSLLPGRQARRARPRVVDGVEPGRPVLGLVGVVAPDAAGHADEVAVQLGGAGRRVRRARQLLRGRGAGGDAAASSARRGLRRGGEGDGGRGVLPGVVVGRGQDHRGGGHEGEEEGGLHGCLFMGSEGFG